MAGTRRADFPGESSHPMGRGIGFVVLCGSGPAPAPARCSSAARDRPPDSHPRDAPRHRLHPGDFRPGPASGLLQAETVAGRGGRGPDRRRRQRLASPAGAYRSRHRVRGPQGRAPGTGCGRTPGRGDRARRLARAGGTVRGGTLLSGRIVGLLRCRLRGVAPRTSIPPPRRRNRRLRCQPRFESVGARKECNSRIRMRLRPGLARQRIRLPRIQSASRSRPPSDPRPRPATRPDRCRGRRLR